MWHCKALTRGVILSFGEQANIWRVGDTRRHNDLASIDSSLLPKRLTMLKSVPFARMQLQNNV
jgi:hypothetical protein